MNDDLAVVAASTGPLHPARVAEAREWSAGELLRVTVGSAPMVEGAPLSWGHPGPDPRPKALSGGKRASRGPTQGGAAREIPIWRGLSSHAAAPACRGDPLTHPMMFPRLLAISAAKTAISAVSELATSDSWG